MTENFIIPIHETFQKTIQGEGYWAGTPVDFIRLAG
ncbi:MAG: 7-carboxy-7-deazaguanine synthase, partial [Trichodesmium sp. St15_bin1_1]|nr:7-carboxy-7-deazaguanine synthase [Trichodesmium sp. St15_bin1_1]